MHQTLRQRRRLSQVSRSHDLTRFQPQAEVVSTKLKQLIDSGAKVISVAPAKVVLRRQESLATVDDWGRVTWTAAPRSSAGARASR